MAGGGVGEAMLIGAAVGAGTGGIMSAAQDKDPLEGALLGAAMGAAGGGIGSAAGGALSGAATGASTGAATGTAGGVAGGVEGGVAGGTAGGTTGGIAGGEVGGTVGGTAGAGTGVGSGLSTGGADILATGGVQGATTGATTTGAGASPAAWGQQGIGQGFAPSLTNAQAYGAGAGGGIMALTGNAQNQGEQWAPEQEPYSGSLSYFKYNPQTFRPSVAPGYADGGVASLQPTAMYPQSQLDTTQFAVPSQRPASREVVNSDYDARINPYTGDMMMASGGISSLGSYSDGGRMLRGPGDGMSDDIPGVIAGKQPARLADGEFVVPADVVSHLGNGSTDAGAKKLYSMMDSVRKARTGTKKQGKQIKAEKHMPGMKSGGIARYDEGGGIVYGPEFVKTVADDAPVTKADLQAAIDSSRSAAPGFSPNFQASGYDPAAQQYSPYTIANRPSSTQPQYYQDIYQPSYPDYSTPGYTLTGGNLGRWSNVAGEADRAAQPASRNQQVTQAYLQNLGRAPDTGGFEYWMGSGLSRPQLDQAFRQSGEYQAMTPGAVNDYYNRYLGRNAEQGGMDFWSQQMGNVGPQAVAQAIQGSSEGQLKSGYGGSEADYINSLYQQFLGRDAEAAGSRFWQEQLGNTISAEQLRQAIQNSEEAQARRYPTAPIQPQANQTASSEEENKRRGGIASLKR